MRIFFFTAFWYVLRKCWSTCVVLYFYFILKYEMVYFCLPFFFIIAVKANVFPIYKVCLDIDLCSSEKLFELCFKLNSLITYSTIANTCNNFYIEMFFHNNSLNWPNEKLASLFQVTFIMIFYFSRVFNKLLFRQCCRV